MPTVAAIIPTYNRARCIARAVESALAQTYDDMEVIVVDDGSTDDTRDIVARFGSAVRYIHQANAGQGPARNHGVRVTDAEWIAFLDSDDVWLPEKTKRQLAFTQSVGADVSFTDFSIKKDLDGEGPDSWHEALLAEGKQVHTRTGLSDAPLDLVLGPGDLISTCTMMVRRSLLLESGGYRAQYRRCQDFDVYVRLAVHHGARFAYLRDVLTKVELGKNATAEQTYRFKLSSLVDAYRLASARGDTAVASRLKQAILHDVRALFGTCRAHRQYLKAADAMTRYLLVRAGLERALPPVFDEAAA